MEMNEATMMTEVSGPKSKYDQDSPEVLAEKIKFLKEKGWEIKIIDLPTELAGMEVNLDWDDKRNLQMNKKIYLFQCTPDYQIYDMVNAAFRMESKVNESELLMTIKKVI